MSKDEVKNQIGQGVEFYVLQKWHVIGTLILIISATLGNIMYGSHRLDVVEQDVKELKQKVEAIHEMRSDLKHIAESIEDIKKWQLRQEESIKEFYKNYKLEPK